MLGRLIRSAAFWSVGGTAAAQLISFAAMLLIARHVSPADYSAAALGIVLGEIGKATFVESIGRALVTVARPSERDYSSWFWRGLLIAGLLAALLLLSGGPLSELTGETRLDAAFTYTAIVLVLAALTNVHVARLSRSFRTLALAFISSAAALAGGAAGLALAVRGFGAWSLLAQPIVLAITACLLTWSVARWLPKLGRGRAVSPPARVVADVGTTGFIRELTGGVDFLAVSRLFTANDAGFYALAKRVTGAISYLAVGPIEKVVVPLFARSRATGARGIGARYIFSLRIGGCLMGLALAPLLVLLPGLVEVVLGPSWADSAWLIFILGLAPYFRALDSYSNAAILVAGRSYLQRRLMMITAALNGVAILVAVNLPLPWVAAAVAAVSCSAPLSRASGVGQSRLITSLLSGRSLAAPFSRST
jgi:O-antigen/teichoic acid export membrane protein